MDQYFVPSLEQVSELYQKMATSIIPTQAGHGARFFKVAPIHFLEGKELLEHLEQGANPNLPTLFQQNFSSEYVFMMNIVQTIEDLEVLVRFGGKLVNQCLWWQDIDFEVLDVLVCSGDVERILGEQLERISLRNLEYLVNRCDYLPASLLKRLPENNHVELTVIVKMLSSKMLIDEVADVYPVLVEKERALVKECFNGLYDLLVKFGLVIDVDEMELYQWVLENGLITVQDLMDEYYEFHDGTLEIAELFLKYGAVLPIRWQAELMALGKIKYSSEVWFGKLSQIRAQQLWKMVQDQDAMIRLLNCGVMLSDNEAVKLLLHRMIPIESFRIVFQNICNRNQVLDEYLRIERKWDTYASIVLMILLRSGAEPFSSNGYSSVTIHMLMWYYPNIWRHELWAEYVAMDILKMNQFNLEHWPILKYVKDPDLMSQFIGRVSEKDRRDIFWHHLHNDSEEVVNLFLDQGIEIDKPPAHQLLYGGYKYDPEPAFAKLTWSSLKHALYLGYQLDLDTIICPLAKPLGQVRWYQKWIPIVKILLYARMGGYVDSSVLGRAIKLPDGPFRHMLMYI